MAGDVEVEVKADTDAEGKALVEGVIDPEISRFERWFRSQKGAGTGLILMEREVLRAYLYQKLTGTL